MPIDPPAIIDYLLGRSLIDAGQIVDGELRVADASRRNTNYVVECTRGPSYLLKMAVSPEDVDTLRTESSIYSALQKGGKLRSGVLARHLVRCYSFDEREGVLALELVRDAETLSAAARRTGKFSASLAAQVGRALAALHNISPDDNPALYGALERSPHKSEPHWVLSLHRSYLRDLDSASGANLECVRMVQDFSEFCNLMDELCALWSTAGGASWETHAPIHCDIKWSNVIVQRQGPNTALTRAANARIKIVDWELARLGDPCWDVGSFLGEYLTYWLLSIPVTGQDPPDKFLSLARYPLAAMRPAVRAFWFAYAGAAGLDADPTQGRVFLDKSVRYAAARLVQSAYEQGQRTTSISSDVVLLLQLAFNILRRPAEAGTALLGLSRPEEASSGSGGSVRS